MPNRHSNHYGPHCASSIDAANAHVHNAQTPLTPKPLCIALPSLMFALAPSLTPKPQLLSALSPVIAAVDGDYHLQSIPRLSQVKVVGA